MRQRPFKQIDVFTQHPYLGNPLAVVLDGSDLSTEAMQHFTNWTNLSEATFLLPPTEAGRAAGADYRVRIFCPGRELPFAGHPTLGSCHAWLEAGGQPQTEGVVVQECALGLITLRRDGDRLAFAAPPLLKSGPLPEADVALIARGLRIERSDIVAHAWCDNGPNWRGVMLGSAEQVLALQPDSAILSKLDVGVVGPRGKVGVVGSHAEDDIAFEVRAFFPGNNGLAEDPVTGSLNAALAQWLIGAHLAPPSYIASQGTALGRAGRVHVQQDGDRIWIGGGSVTCVNGEVLL
ncbi:PhzF family phenazine biosynthesis protein [Acidovorax sp. SUPP3334]|uniref:PhzF family phenazine biosynthesis protein n=1 Tax=Acidovorax sp. SUPP3334 TaxID=2920881 RepID=UPI0023DE5013|nr:PhzF family phenazine biosynthesis protein [Acidovorax sp. SUPP3334]GKT25466.1 PhzF family phenazine biosynthesis protein [Acidovorax sp. SUPP3334]